MSRRVLHVAQPKDGGVARHVADLVRAQSAAGWDVHLAACGDPTWRDRLEGADVVLHAWDAARTPGTSSLRDVLRLRGILREVRPELVHLHSATAGFAGRLALRGGVATVYTPHAWSFQAVTGAARKGAQMWERLACRWTDRVLCVSHAEREVGRRHGISARYAVIHNGVDLARFTVCPASDRLRARGLLNLSDGPIALCVGRLAVDQKGQDLLLAAWRDVQAALPQARLVLVGDGPDEQLLRSAAVGSVLFAGADDDVATWLAAADVVVMPSRYEGMAQVPLEAMASGRTVVAYDVEGVQETLGVPGDDGSVGAVVPCRDIPGLARVLTSRLADRDLADADGLQGRARAEQLFDLRGSHAATSALYEDVWRSASRTPPGCIKGPSRPTL